MQVVNGIEPCAQNFPAPMQVMQIGTRKILTGIAIATCIERLIFVLVTRILDLDIAVTSE